MFLCLYINYWHCGQRVERAFRSTEVQISLDKKIACNDCSFYDSKIFRDRSQVCVSTTTYKNFCLKKKNNFRPKRVKIENNLIKNRTSCWLTDQVGWNIKLVLAGHSVKRGGVHTLIVDSATSYHTDSPHVRVPFYPNSQNSRIQSNLFTLYKIKKCSQMSIIRNQLAEI